MAAPLGHPPLFHPTLPLLHSVGMLPWQKGLEGRTQGWVNFSHRGRGQAGGQAFLQHSSKLCCRQTVALSQERMCAQRCLICMNTAYRRDVARSFVASPVNKKQGLLSF